jgi:hypothetical protein
MARLRIKALIAFLLLACGAWLMIQAVTPHLLSLVGGNWILMLALGAALIFAATFLGRRP